MPNKKKATKSKKSKYDRGKAKKKNQKMAYGGFKKTKPKARKKKA